ncbi:response regulator receiver and ANTAR domain protein [Carboxydocella sporoproducens DSM 16521]|uniref:Stage 0 sporulation protein A homolog n=2 Tax=Carboxydocella TaxID=178898 RepID=A0A1T4PDI8_9FIRM|nr:MULTISPECIES: ANTAR domain-containing protein [Carboxydocella]AVX21417.1 response regulator receiver and ANTAR domain protein [Carboxydocella thermautotrophica]AVX31905.1 response regulator receiver and ANTAR domain protein [Carboxydocella thermautotrophica]GAW28495.1 Fis family transcriptional regulator [Carboxydocella sp. ULO1]SJZ89604.1 response regulator receiver and ANTAR domain protein [Carboxydocella sporoproducens DSM 16521]
MQLRTVVAEKDGRTRNKIKEILSRAGFIVIGEASDSATALTLARATQPDLVVLATNLPGLPYLELVRILDQERLAPVLVLANYSQAEELRTIVQTSWAVSYLLKPVNELNLLPAVDLALARFRQSQELIREIQSLKDDLETRKLLDQAKAMLIKYRQMTEEQAYRYIQKLAMDKRQTKAEVARAIILAFAE